MHTELANVPAWFKANALSSFATCSMTQAGFVRITGSAEVLRQPYSVSEARQLLLTLTQHPGHTLWPTTISYFEAGASFEHRMHGPKQVTDAYLPGLAKHHGGQLAALNKAVVSLAGPEFSDLVVFLG